MLSLSLLTIRTMANVDMQREPHYELSRDRRESMVNGSDEEAYPADLKKVEDSDGKPSSPEPSLLSHNDVITEKIAVSFRISSWQSLT